MNMDIDIFDYITPDKISEIVEDELRRSIRSQITKEADLERVLTNFTCEYVFKLIEYEWAANAIDFEKTLREKIVDTIERDDILYYVFRRKDAWERTESPAVKILDEECANSRPLIRAMVEKQIREYPFNELHRDEIGDVIYNVIMEKILKPNKGEEQS